MSKRFSQSQEKTEIKEEQLKKELKEINFHEHLEWFITIEKLKNSTENTLSTITPIQRVLNNIKVMVSELNERINSIELHLSKKANVFNWKNFLSQLQKLIGIEQISHVFDTCFLYGKNNEKAFYKQQIEVVRYVVDNILNRSLPIVLSAHFSGIESRLVIDRSQTIPMITESKYIIHEMEYVPITERMNQQKQERELQAYKAFFDEIMDINNTNDTNETYRNQFEDDPEEMKQLARNVFNKKVEEKSQSEYVKSIESFGERMIEYEEIIREKNNEIENVKSDYEKQINDMKENYQLEHENDTKQIIKLADEKESLNTMILYQISLIQSLYETTFTKIFNERKDEYPYIVNHRFISSTNEQNRIHVFTVNQKLLENKETIILPIFQTYDWSPTCEIVNVEYKLKESDKNYKYCLGYFQLKGSVIKLGKDSYNKREIRYHIQIVSQTNSNKEPERTKPIQTIHYNESTDIYQQNEHQIEIEKEEE